jgi:hypothetical protein
MGRASVRLARHGLFGHLYLRTIMVVLASVAHLSPFYFFSLPSWLYLRATHSRQRAYASSPYSSDTSLDTDSRSGYCTSTRMFHIMRTIIFAIVGRLVRLPGLRLILPPQPAALAHGRSHEPTDARQRGYRVSQSCSWPLSVRAVEQDMVTPVMLRLSWQ